MNKGFEDLSGLWLFFRYAFPCIEIRLAKKALSPKCHRKLIKIFRVYIAHCPERIRPESLKKTLCEAFPDAAQSILTHSETTGRSPFSLENMQDYWRNHHQGPSPVEYRWVEQIIQPPAQADDPTLIFYIVSGACSRAKTNPFFHQIQEGDQVTTHANAIIEVITVEHPHR